MPAGSGPQITAISSIAVGTSEAVIATLSPGNWNSFFGNLISFFGYFTPPATTDTLTLKLRQGTTTSGAQIGVTQTQAFTASVPSQAQITALDNSAFGLFQQGGQYCVTASYTVTGGTMTSGILELETCAPVQ